MKEHKFKNYIYIGVVAVLVIVSCIVVAFTFLKWNSVTAGIDKLNGILAPVTYGAILAYLLTPVYNRVRNGGERLFQKVVAHPQKRTGLAKVIATTVSLIVLGVVVLGLLLMIIPQVIQSIMGIVNTLPSSAEKVSRWIETIFADNPQVEAAVLDAYNQGIAKLITWSTTALVPNLEKIIGGVLCRSDRGGQSFDGCADRCDRYGVYSEYQRYPVCSKQEMHLWNVIIAGC